MSPVCRRPPRVRLSPIPIRNRPGCAGTAFCRRCAGRQNQPRPVCRRIGRHPLALWCAAQSLRYAPHTRRFEFRIGGCSGRGARQLCPRHRHEACSAPAASSRPTGRWTVSRCLRFRRRMPARCSMSSVLRCPRSSRPRGVVCGIAELWPEAPDLACRYQAISSSLVIAKPNPFLRQR
jgi:hypothetical protein